VQQTKENQDAFEVVVVGLCFIRGRSNAETFVSRDWYRYNCVIYPKPLYIILLHYCRIVQEESDKCLGKRPKDLLRCGTQDQVGKEGIDERMLGLHVDTSA